MNVADIRALLNENPEDPGLLHMAVLKLMEQQHFGLAYNVLARAVMISDAIPQVSDHQADRLTDLAIVQMILASSAQAEVLFEHADRSLTKALALEPRHAKALAARGTYCLNMGDPVAAEKHLRASLEIQDTPGAHNSLAGSLLARGIWPAGWDHYEKGIGVDAQRQLPRVPFLPYWNGEKTERLVVIGEQGVGDEISLASAVPDAARDMPVTLVCDPRLKTLFARSFPGVAVRGERAMNAMQMKAQAEVPTFSIDGFSNAITGTARCLSSSLMRHYRRSDAEFPRTAFLRADEARVAQIRAELDALPGKKVGIAWAGGLQQVGFTHRRSLEEPDLLALTAIPGITWVSLAYETDRFVERKCLPGMPVFEPRPETAKGRDIDDLASLLMALDGVVTVTTTVAHLCGALGKKAHVLVPRVARWFYGMHGSRSAWYDSLVLHRQTEAWPIEDVKNALREELGL